MTETIWPQKPKKVYYIALYRKSLLTSRIVVLERGYTVEIPRGAFKYLSAQDALERASGIITL